MRFQGSIRTLTVTSVAALTLAACGGGGGGAATGGSTTEPVATEAAVTASSSTASTATEPAAEPAADPGADGVRSVPEEYDTIQAAVDASVEGDLVVIAPGSYHEAVDVSTDNLTIRGLDRDGVVLDGEMALDNGVRVLGAKGVAIENLTAMNYTNNGVFFVSVSGYRASYITTYRTGDYGIYAFDSVKGQIEHSHTVGSKDAGVYVGQCYPCDAVVDDVVSEYNGLGYSGTNSGGNLLLVNSTFRFNRVGVVSNSATYELCYPQRRTTIAGNLVYSNNQTDVAGIGDALLFGGNGIVFGGGIGNLVSRNRVFDHNRIGIGLGPYYEDAPNDVLPPESDWQRPCAEQKNDTPEVPAGLLLWDSYDNQVLDNVVSDSRIADIAVASVGTDISTLRNCWGGNEFQSSAPLELEQLAPCEGEGSPDGDWTANVVDVAAWLAEKDALPPSPDWQTAPLPDLGAHGDMPDAATAPARPATDVPIPVDLDAITVPDAPTP
jgi:hypothetical protein